MFLAWMFYELSGGADFVPRGVRPPKPAPQVAAIQPRSAPEGTEPRLAPRQPRDTDPDSDTDFSRFTAETQRAALKARQATRADRLEQLRHSLNQGIAITPGKVGFGASGGSIALTSLEQGLAGFEETTPVAVADSATEPMVPPAPAPAPDLRAVSGTRVNMRDGPGTIYPVVARLVMGHQVEVLSTSGTGWLRLRTLPERQIGWVAASLVSKKAE
ncbi:MAG: SH3 domain-containing protein [Pseudodonghicola sp.]|nr:SH3 domain-containing protein [Pseudodonghicola sp.]